MKKIKGLLFGIVVFLGIGVSSSFYVDLTSVNPIGGSVYNVLGFVSAHRLLYYNNGNWPLVNQSGVYNTSLTSFSSTNNNSFILNDSIYLTDVYYSSGNLFLSFNDGTNFGFGNFYSSSLSDYSVINDLSNGGIRLIFDTPVGSVGNNPILNFNISNLNDASNVPVVGYESYATRNVATNLGLIIDYGTQGIKGKHFGLDSWGYSYGVNFSSDSSQISWDSFSFSSIGSKCLKSSLDLGLANFDHLVSSNCMNLGILVLKNNGYDYNAGGQGKYLLLSKNPDSYSDLLYEVLDCSSYDNMDWLPNLMDSNNCVSLQHGTINGVLPFTDSGTSVSISSLNGFFGSIFNSSLYGFASFDDYGLTFLDFRYGDCYNGGYWDYCIGPTQSFSKLSFNPSTSIPSIKEIYISNGGQVGPGGNGNQSTGSIAINAGLLNSCLNDLTFGELNSYLCNQLLSHLGYPVQIPGTSGQYISVSIDENGNLKYRITTQEDLAEQMSGFIWVENEDGTWSTVCPSGDCLGTVLAQPINHGFSTGDVLDMITNLTGWVGRCPFPYTDFRLGKNLKLLQLLQDYGFNYDPFIIINCSVAGFQYGRNTIDNTLFGDTFEHPLLYGDTPKHRSLFVFLDFLVILGLFGLFIFIKKIF